MIEFQVKFSASLEKALADAVSPIDQRTAEQVGVQVIKEMKSLVSKGISPIDGEGKFPKYKNPQKYPGSRKAKSPVNLKLSGDFLNALSHRLTAESFGKGTELFFSNGQDIKEIGHRDGARGQPERPIMPSEKNEQFVRIIRDVYTELYRERIVEVLRGKG